MRRLKVVIHLRTGQTIEFKARKVMAYRTADGSLGAVDFLDAPNKPLYLDLSTVAALTTEAE